MISSKTDQHGGARFLVQDSGPGIEAAQLPRLFERCHRADAPRTRATGGTGLSLAICKAVVDAHGGAISVESEPRRGSIFTVRLPL